MTKSDVNLRFLNLISRINDEKWPVYGAQIYKNNELVNQFGNTKERFPIYSITKSIVSLGTGIAEAEGLVNLKDPFLNYISEDLLKNVNKEQIKRFENITIERLLAMSVKGFDFRPASENFMTYALNTQINPDKVEFHYTNICAYLIGAALTSAVEKPLYDYLNEKLFQPMEIENPPYQLTPEGFFYGATGMMLSVEELSRLGLMMLNNGKYKDKQIVPEDYIKRATAVQIKNREEGYGYFFWKFGSGFSMNGKWGQKVFCIPEEDIVITTVGNFQEGSEVLKEEVRSWFK